MDIKNDFDNTDIFHPLKEAGLFDDAKEAFAVEVKYNKMPEEAENAYLLFIQHLISKSEDEPSAIALSQAAQDTQLVSSYLIINNQDYLKAQHIDPVHLISAALIKPVVDENPDKQVQIQAVTSDQAIDVLAELDGVHLTKGKSYQGASPECQALFLADGVRQRAMLSLAAEDHVPSPDNDDLLSFKALILYKEGLNAKLGGGNALERSFLGSQENFLKACQNAVAPEVNNADKPFLKVVRGLG